MNQGINNTFIKLCLKTYNNYKFVWAANKDKIFLSFHFYAWIIDRDENVISFLNSICLPKDYEELKRLTDRGIKHFYKDMVFHYFNFIMTNTKYWTLGGFYFDKKFFQKFKKGNYCYKISVIKNRPVAYIYESVNADPLDYCGVVCGVIDNG